jgi:ribokinase
LLVVNLAANEHLDPKFVREQAGAFARAKRVLLQLENNLDAIRAGLDLGTEHGLLRMLNPAPVHPELEAAMLRRCDLITPNETEFALLLEHVAGERVAAATLVERPNSELHALARKLGVPTVVVTLGAEGCFVSHDDAGDRRGDAKPYYRIPAEKVEAVDSTGAGDAFSGALAAAMLRFADRPFRDAVVHANRAAAMSTEVVGTAPAMATFDSVRRRFG